VYNNCVYNIHVNAHYNKEALEASTNAKKNEENVPQAFNF